MRAGALSDILHASADRRTALLPSPQRLRIAADVAAGLEYLHSSDRGHNCIVHRDVKTANILLDGVGGARLGDVGLARDSERGTGQTTMQGAIGTIGYIDPEYHETLELTLELQVLLAQDNVR